MPLRSSTFNINIRSSSQSPPLFRMPTPAREEERAGRVTSRTFWCNPTPYEWECELGSGPNEAKITRKLEAGYAYAGSVPVHGSNGDLPTAEDGKRHLSSRIPVR
jgi:hypothetical protein